MTTSVAACDARPLESALFGIGIVAAAPECVSDVAQCIATARAMSAQLVVLRIATPSTELAREIESCGGTLSDTLVTLARTLPSGGLDASLGASHEVRLALAQSGDATPLSELARIAFAGFSGHWHTDSRSPATTANELYARWAADLVQRAGPASPVWVTAENDGTLSAFLAVHERVPTVWSVPLTAVHPRYRGRGTLAQLLVVASQHLAAAGPVTLEYETQVTNAAALRTVRRLGFTPVRSRMTFHLWIDAE